MYFQNLLFNYINDLNKIRDEKNIFSSASIGFLFYHNRLM